MRSGKVNICRPGFNASCALCCGSHNFDLTEEELYSYLKGRVGTAGFVDNGKPRALLERGMQCPMLAIDGAGDLIGCMAYNDMSLPDPDMNAFFYSTCKTFLCRAADVLADEEILFAAELARDWYFYPMLIHECRELKKLMSLYDRPSEVDIEAISYVKSALIFTFLSSFSEMGE